jgi:hypothetical protein
MSDERKDGEERQLSRRELIETTAAALLATPLLKAVPGIVRPAGAAPRFFTAAEYRLVDELTEMIIPADQASGGARAAGVAAYLDARLAESLEKDRQADWRTGLAAVDDLARSVAGKPFMEAAPPQRLAVLTQMAAHESSPQTPAERFFLELKRQTVRVYYTSQIGIHDDQQYQGNVYQSGEYSGYDAK